MYNSILNVQPVVWVGGRGGKRGGFEDKDDHNEEYSANKVFLFQVPNIVLH